ncbi:DUF2489 domain-containing protein [Shewanella salipaludis]|uniref:DUF2489 domain-containing protein n=1 Tax=Shewanella salipaludis TaxID=2723052 RepID=A0A972JKZ2_9GAMM|nr:DUF2489 domain-containing protein [Shewanella salipaludis]
MSTALIILGLIVIVALSGYATSLLLRLRRQSHSQREAALLRKAEADAKRAGVLDDIRYIATAMVEERCEISEGVVRIVKLFEAISLSERVSPDYPTLFMHFDRIKAHPIMEARQALPKQERMKLDLARMKSEAELEEGILHDARKLMDYRPKAMH